MTLQMFDILFFNFKIFPTTFTFVIFMCFCRLWAYMGSLVHLSPQLFAVLSLTVDFEWTLSHEWIITVFTFKYTRICMLSSMIYQMTLSCERFTAPLKFTSEWFFTSMYPHMSFQVTVFSETFATYLTNERFDASMRPLMYLEPVRSIVSFATYFTFVWLLSGMY